ncbi:MAG: DUF4143 domain-containing protein [Gemmatimonadetes bacterium]|nr:DUF4143 domain-containing protein [Gemmatimonadota bacterium]
MHYRPRIVDAELAERLAATGAVVVEGPKACGKTATGRNFAASEVLLDVDRNARRMVGVDPDSVLRGKAPRLIDEWQTEPDIWNHVRRAVDDRASPGQFILTGSAVPADDVTRHTGAGRLTRLRMRPFSLFEAGHSSGEVSLRQLLDGAPQRSDPSRTSVSQLAELVCRGGWPGHYGQPIAQSIRRNRDYLNEIRRVDMSRVSGRRRDPVKIRRLLGSLARNVATPATLSTLVTDVQGSGTSMQPETAAAYLEALERLMIVEDQPAWAPHLRSRTTLRTSPVRHLVDPSLAVAALRATPERLMADLEYFGFLFESLVVRDLRVYAQANDAEVFHYREKGGLEVDAVVEADDGRWAAFEVKLGERWVEEGAANLRRLAARMKRGGRGDPSALAVILPNGYGHVRGAEVGVIPIGALGP